MHNRRIICVFLIVLTSYSLFQIYLYTYVHKDGIEFEKKSRGEAKTRKVPDSLEDLKTFVDVSHEYGIPLILLDPAVLKIVINTTTSSIKSCHFFCKKRLVTVFGVFSQLMDHGTFVDSMRLKGFSLVFHEETDEETLDYLSLGDQTPVYTHYFLQRTDHIIHLIVMYERTAGYWWHGRIIADNLRGDVVEITQKLADIALFGKKAGTYNRMEIIKTTMDSMRLRAPRYPQLFLDQLQYSTFIQCNHSRAKLFYSKYGYPDDSNSNIFRDSAKKILSQAKHSLDSIGVRFWLSSGTCLGWYRQCDTMAYGEDVDLGIWIKDYDRRLIPMMQDNGLSLIHVFGKESDSFELSFLAENIKLDVFFFYEEKDHMWNGGTQAKTGKKFKYIFPNFTLCWTEFLDLKVRVPCEAETYLEANYGKNWFEPVKDWDWKIHPSNVQENGQWPKSEWDKVIRTLDT